MKRFACFVNPLVFTTPPFRRSLFVRQLVPFIGEANYSKARSPLARIFRHPSLGTMLAYSCEAWPAVPTAHFNMIGTTDEDRMQNVDSRSARTHCSPHSFAHIRYRCYITEHSRNDQSAAVQAPTEEPRTCINQ